MQYVQYFAVLGYHKTEAWSLALEGSGQRNKMAAGVPRGQPWCLLFVLIRQGLRGGSGSQRLTRALGIETGNPITLRFNPARKTLDLETRGKNSLGI